MTYTIPWGFLTAVLLVFGKLSGENELIALKSMGVSIPRICVPLLFLSFVCVGICLWINLEVAPRAQAKMKETLVKIVTENPLALFGSDHVIDEFPGKKIYVEEKQGTELKNILVYEMDKDANLLRVIFAKKGQLQTKNGEVLLHIYDARLEMHDTEAPGDFEKIHPAVMKESVFSISLQDLYEKNKRLKGPGSMLFKELIDYQKMLKTVPDSISANMRSVVRTELNKRFSLSLASFALALMAVPLAITAHRKETSIGFLFSIIVGFSYFFFGQVATMAQNNPKLHPEIMVWLPNIIFILLGGVLFWRLSRK
jgi:lipopolysaccharide export system permease protein